MSDFPEPRIGDYYHSLQDAEAIGLTWEAFIARRGIQEWYESSFYAEGQRVTFEELRCLISQNPEMECVIMQTPKPRPQGIR